MAENLFSKHRPLTFDQIYGHDKIKKEFIKRANEDNFPQAILISGKTGTGKNCFEKIISKTILCSHKENNSPCSTCEQCQTVIQEKISQHYYLFNASNLGIDEMRSIEEIASKKALSTVQKKVIVVDELQELGSQQKSLKAILKILEKPAKNVHFVLLCMDESKIPAALKNRCVHYKLNDLTFEEISRNIKSICDKEGIKIDTTEKIETLITIAQNSDGSMRTAISYLERCIYSELWNPNEVLNELGIISTENLSSIINKLLSGDVSVFDNTITKDVLEKIRWILNVLFKSVNKVSLNGYQKSCISGIKSTTSENIFNTIDKLNKITFFPYTSQELIDFTLIDILTSNKKALTSGEPGTKRVRVRVE
jgi:DNA polymerase-3 subunit gamma/tau